MSTKAQFKEARIRLPISTHDWLKEQVRRNGGSMAAEVTRAIADRMERVKAEKRAINNRPTA